MDRVKDSPDLKTGKDLRDHLVHLFSPQESSGSQYTGFSCLQGSSGSTVCCQLCMVTSYFEVLLHNLHFLRALCELQTLGIACHLPLATWQSPWTNAITSRTSQVPTSLLERKLVGSFLGT